MVPRDQTAIGRPLLVFSAIAVGTTSAVSMVAAYMGWTVRSPAWSVLAPIAMWAPALGRVVVLRTVDRGFTGTLPLSRWGATGAQVILVPLLIPLVVYLARAACFRSWPMCSSADCSISP